MAQALRRLLIFLFIAFVYSNSYAVKVLPMDGTSVSLARGFEVKPSSVVSSELETETPSLGKFQHAPADVESEQCNRITVTKTIKPKPLITPTLIEPTEVAEGMIDDITPTSVVTTSASETVDVAAVDALDARNRKS